MASLEVVLGVAAAVVLLGVLAVRASVRLGLPSLLLYLGIGILLGESVLGVQFSDAGLTEAAARRRAGRGTGTPTSCARRLEPDRQCALERPLYIAVSPTCTLPVIGCQAGTGRRRPDPAPPRVAAA